MQKMEYLINKTSTQIGNLEGLNIDLDNKKYNATATTASVSNTLE